MTIRSNASLHPVAVSVLALRAGSGADAVAIAAAAGRAYADLTGVLVTLIGPPGVEALTARASHLALLEYPNEQAVGKNADMPFAHIASWLELQDPAVAADAAAAMLSALGGLLVTFVGEPLTMRLLQKAWPDGFPISGSEEIAK
jgi:hypothetical protein